MRTITGKFVRPFDGKPASHGVLRLELVAEEGELHELSPIGDGAEPFRIPFPEDIRNDWRTEKRRWMSEREIAVVEAEEFKPQYVIPPVQEVFLDADGCIPTGTQVLGNDELTGNTTYRATVDVPRDACRGRNTNCFQEEIRIAGEAPVDIHDAVLREREPEVPPPTPRELELAANAAIVRDGTAKFGRKNRIGFYAGSIHCPGSNPGSVSLPSLESGEFGIFAFHLPMSAVVNTISVHVDAAAKGTLRFGLYDASGRKCLEAEIDLIRAGAASGVLPIAINLSEGDYFMAWASETSCTAELRALGILDQLKLMNASGAPVMGVGKPGPRQALPDVLGIITRTSSTAPILAYLKG